MRQVKQLTNLSDELLLETVARVPYDAFTWSSISLVNRRFKSIMATNSLPAKAIKIQFSIQHCLLPPGQNDGNRLRLCRSSSIYASSHAAKLSRRRDNRELLGIMLLLPS